MDSNLQPTLHAFTSLENHCLCPYMAGYHDMAASLKKLTQKQRDNLTAPRWEWSKMTECFSVMHVFSAR